MAIIGPPGAMGCSALVALVLLAAAVQSASPTLQSSAASYACNSAAQRHVRGRLALLRIRGGSAFAALEDEAGKSVAASESGSKGKSSKGDKAGNKDTKHQSPVKEATKPEVAIPDHNIFNPPAVVKAQGNEEETNAEAEKASDVKVVAADVKVGAKEPEGGADTAPTAQELEEESYRQMQNFDDYTKSKPKSKLTLAGLLGKAGNGDTAAAEEAANAEEAADEEYNEEEYHEGAEDGEEEYYEEEGEHYEVPELDGVAALRPRKERDMEKLADWWSGSLGVDIENERHNLKRSAEADDAVALEGKAQLAADMLNTPGGRPAGAGGDTRGLIRRPNDVPADDDGRTQYLVDKLFAEQRAGVKGKQTAGSQTMFQRAEASRGFGARGGRGGGSFRGGDRGRGGGDGGRGGGFRGGDRGRGGGDGFRGGRRPFQGARSASAAGADAVKRGVCHDFRNTGTCNFGTNCRYSHDLKVAGGAEDGTSAPAGAEGVGGAGAGAEGGVERAGASAGTRGRFPSRGFIPRGRGGMERGRGAGGPPGARGGFVRGGFRGARGGTFEAGARGAYRGAPPGGFGRGARGASREGRLEGNVEDEFPTLRSALAAA